MQDDPFLGNGTFGQLSRFGPERVYVMHSCLSELEGDGWKSKSEFHKFRHSLKGIGGSKDGLGYIEKVIKVFFERYRCVFEKHMVSKWLASGTLHYMLGGKPYLA